MVRSTKQSTDGSGMDETRRRFIKGTGAAATVGMAGLAGCSGILGGGGGPKKPIQAYVNAINNGNAQKANNQVHPDATGGEVTEASLSMFESVDFSVQSMSVLENSDGVATVEVTLKASGGGMSETSTSEWEVRQHEGSWLIYSSSTV